jgi:hypothetical protein
MKVLSCPSELCIIVKPSSASAAATAAAAVAGGSIAGVPLAGGAAAATFEACGIGWLGFGSICVNVTSWRICAVSCSQHFAAADTSSSNSDIDISNFLFVSAFPRGRLFSSFSFIFSSFVCFSWYSFPALTSLNSACCSAWTASFQFIFPTGVGPRGYGGGLRITS